MTSTIKICMGSSCFARGNAKNLQLIQSFLSERGIESEIELTGLRCCNDCSKGPNIKINDKNYNNIDRGSLLDILEHHFNQNEE